MTVRSRPSKTIPPDFTLALDAKRDGPEWLQATRERSSTVEQIRQHAAVEVMRGRK